MSHHYKTLVQVVTAICLVTLTGCIIDPNQNGSYGSSARSYNQPHNSGTSHSAASGHRNMIAAVPTPKPAPMIAVAMPARPMKTAGTHAKPGRQSEWRATARRRGSRQASLPFPIWQLGRVQTVTDLKPGFWEIIVTDNSGRKVACTADAKGKVSDWVEM